MLVLKKNVKIKELEKYGFKIQEQPEEEYYGVLAYKCLGSHFDLVIENDEYYRQLTIVPKDNFGIPLCVDNHLDAIYELIKKNLIEKGE